MPSLKVSINVLIMQDLVKSGCTVTLIMEINQNEVLLSLLLENLVITCTWLTL